MGMDRHNCFGYCAVTNAKMLTAVTAWRDAIADMIPREGAVLRRHKGPHGSVARFIKKAQKTPVGDLELARKSKSKHKRGLKP